MAVCTRSALITASILLVMVSTAWGAKIAGSVRDTEGRPIERARIDHIGTLVVVPATELAVKPGPEEVRTDAAGHFAVVTGVPAIVIRKPGYESQRIRIAGNAEVSITLVPIRSTSRCRLPVRPKFKTQRKRDIDYAANGYYIQTKDGPRGIISGRGVMYSFGAPSDDHVWKSVEYSEFMFKNGVIDAAGRSPDGKYWRSRSIMGASAEYYHQDRETAEQLDCVMDGINVLDQPRRKLR